MSLSKYIKGGIFLLMALSFSLCTDPDQSSDQKVVMDSLQQSSPALEKDSIYVQKPVFQLDTFRKATYILYKVDPKTEDIRLFNTLGADSVHTFQSIQHIAEQENKTLQFVTNGGMFTANRKAKGLLVLAGETIQEADRATSGYGNFYMQPNGIFAIDSSGSAHIVPTQQYDSLAEKNRIWYATQSGPMLIIDSTINNKFTDGSKNKHIRNAVGITPTGQVVFAISQIEISFFDLSTVLLKQGCVQALYLDGFVSKVFIPAYHIGKVNEGKNLGPLIAIFE